ncbi:hypothetical protein MAFF211479_49170 (plasmid) [Ralstonia solanacearum]|nr:hypothetical protein 10 [Ralstonia solanacearum]BCI56315.1 hypothetical protein 10 [Ralstonia solanacearum]BCI56354.1 hypothetical protein 11 [Ralstonia solanacearum]BCL95215.1 hypothetical protein MAFF211479_49170 [Ralstonia solanacearum]BCM00319.1 hypothetical protein MAFF211491_47720 [Ralstonia solanacearum]
MKRYGIWSSQWRARQAWRYCDSHRVCLRSGLHTRTSTYAWRRTRWGWPLSPAEVDVGLYHVRQRADPQYTAHRLFDEDVLTVC